ncbi:MAG: OmpA family protein [Bacteroidales bacterium]|nr:OmpA family protein [Bacteroidales bacterium]
MRKLTLLFFANLLTLMVMAQTADNKWALGLGAGPYFSHRQELLGGVEQSAWKSLFLTSELSLGRYLTPSFDAVLKGNIGFRNLELASSGDKAKTDFTNVALNLKYKLANDILFSSDAKIQPYLFAGPSMLTDNDDVKLDFNGGLGFKFPVGSGKNNFYLEGKYLDGLKPGLEPNYSPDGITDIKDNHVAITAGMEFGLGKAKDSDGDGVPDRKDKCPNTPAGVAVDADGCPLDRDGDGVPDYKDDCPDTPGLASLNGCPDKDGDGIADHLDDCPDVPGLKKFNGCPDTDGDGVPDPKDECPDTPKGCAVDAKGCPLDSDGDGVIDCEDQCPNQPGPKENKGCPITCVDFDVDPVYFDFDRATLRPEGQAALDAFMAKLGDCKNYEVVVNGHTCSIGSTRYNQGLSERRAQEVVKYLITKGMNNAYIGSKGYGETQPAVPNTNKANREKNRRAEIDLTIK